MIEVLNASIGLKKLAKTYPTNHITKQVLTACHNKSQPNKRIIIA